MELTSAQCTIVEKVCSAQFASLEDLLRMDDLGILDNGEHYNKILADVGLDKLDFDREVIETYDRFQIIQMSPNKLFEILDIVDIEIFEYIMFLYRNQLENKYPKAYANLMQKLFIWKQIHIFRS